jgi:hypothetical protein
MKIGPSKIFQDRFFSKRNELVLSLRNQLDTQAMPLMSQYVSPYLLLRKL